MNWNSVIEGIAAGVAASVLLAAFVILRDFVRNAYLRFSIGRQFNLLSHGAGLDGISVSISNHIGKAFTVRQVVLKAGKMGYRLNASGDAETSFKNQHRKLSREEVRKLKRGEIVEVGSEMGVRKWRTEPTSEGFTLVAPFTLQRFVLPARLLPTIDEKVTELSFVVEYESWTGGLKIMRVQKRDGLERIDENISDILEQIKGGTFNEARERFGMAPIVPRGQRGHEEDDCEASNAPDDISSQPQAAK